MTIALTSPVLVARERESAALRELVDAAASGTPGLLVLSGEAGVGKTRLVEQALDYAAAQGLRTLIGHCVQLGTEGLAYAAVIEAMRQVARTGLDDVLGPARDLVSRLMGTRSEVDAGALAAGQVLELVLGLVERLSQDRPLLLVFEDLHWADRSTLDLAAFLAQNLRGMPVALVFTYRADEVGRLHPLRQLHATWQRTRGVSRVALDRFDRDGVRALLTAILAEEPPLDTVDLVFERSEGNAFLAEEVLAMVRADETRLPQSLRDVLLARLDGLRQATTEVLQLAAIAGRSVPERLLVAASARPEADVLAAIREAVEAHLLVVDEAGLGYRFRHMLARDAVHDDMLPGERVQLHARCAEVLAANPELFTAAGLSVSASLAHHAYACFDLPTALAASIRAAAEASAQFAAHEALTHYERALEIWPRVGAGDLPEGLDQAEVMRLAGAAALHAGDLDRALHMLLHARTGLPGDAPPERQAAIARGIASALVGLGRNHDGAEVLGEALADDLAPAVRAAVEAELAAALMREFDLEGCLEIAERAVATARAAGLTEVGADALITLGVSRSLLGSDQGLADLREGIALAEATGNDLVAARGCNNLADMLETQGRSGEATAVAAAGIEHARRVGVLRTSGAYLVANLAESHLRLGEWARAEELVEDSLERLPEGVFGATVQLIRGELATLRGQWDELPRILAALRQVAIDSDDPQFILPIAQLEAEFRRSVHDWDGALAAVLDTISGSETLERYVWPLLWTGARAEAERAAVTGQAPDPRLVALVASTTAKTPPTGAYRALAQAELAWVGSAVDDAPWRGAADAWRDLDWPWPLAYTLLRLAESLADAGNLAAAREPLLAAQSLADGLGATPLGERAALLARRARLVPTATEMTATENDPLARYSLTAREREVLLLLASGRTNPEIGKDLFISAKTASTHVSNLLAKLGVETRVQAAGLVHRLGVE